MFGIESIAVGAFRWVYRWRQPSPLQQRKPRLAWFPKYRTELQLPAAVVEAEDPSEQLESRLQAFGFTLDSWTKDRIRFTRGKAWGDFSIKLVKLDLSLPYPLERESHLQLEVASVCLFDTGDVWTVCREVVDRLGAETSRENPTSDEVGSARS